jgi:hypothetical protein
MFPTNYDLAIIDSSKSEKTVNARLEQGESIISHSEVG